MNFIDHAIIYIKAGDGGNGCVAFLREKFRPKGGPSGGDGGNGGSVIFQSDFNLSTLHDLTYHKKYIANNGQNGKGKNMHGKNGQNIIVKVPVGTIIKNLKDNNIIYDFDKPNIDIVIAKGGNGGFGNARFKTQKNTAPRIANDGQEGQEYDLELELKVLADVGLVGFPNAGKSTFISVISNAKPKIADYPFTTLVPNLGIVKYEHNSFVIADIPGLIKGASDGKGLGIQFLKHIDRTKILAFMIDVNSKDIIAEYETLCDELKKYKTNLLKKPHLLLLSKTDIKNKDKIKTKNLPKIDIVEISSHSKIGINSAIQLMHEKITSI